MHGFAKPGPASPVPVWPNPIWSVCLLLVLVALGSGCANMKKTDTARTGKEQLLISNAVDQSLSKVNFEPFAGRAVYVEEKYLDCVDKGYVASSIRHRVSRAGGTLVSKVEDADVYLEMRSGGVGTDNAESYLGVPEIVLPGMLTLPEVKLIARSNQTAVAKIAMAAYDAKSMTLLGDGGATLSKSTDNNWFVLGAGPYQDGTVKREVARSTSWTNQNVHAELPPYVAFDSPQSEPGRVQLSSDAKELPPPPQEK
jgi:hypothetical protein